MRGNDLSQLEQLFALSKTLDLKEFEKYITLYLSRKADKKLALQELDHLIGTLQNHILLLSMHIKQNYLLKEANRTMPTNNSFYTKQEVAIKYRVSVRTVTNWIIDGLETVVIGGVTRISQQAIEQFAKSNKTKKFNWRSIARKND